MTTSPVTTMHTYCALFIVVISTNSLGTRGQAAVRTGGLLRPTSAPAEPAPHAGGSELEIRFQVPLRAQADRFLLPRRCHAKRKQVGSGGTNRDIEAAQVCVVTAEARDG
jgi:hypothetical protein